MERVREEDAMPVSMTVRAGVMLAVALGAGRARCDPPEAPSPRAVFGSNIPTGYPRDKSLETIRLWLWAEYTRLATEQHRKMMEGVVHQPGSCGGSIGVSSTPGVLPLEEWHSLAERAANQLENGDVLARTEALYMASELQQVGMVSRASGVLTPHLRSAVVERTKDEDGGVRARAIGMLASFSEISGGSEAELRSVVESLSSSDASTRAAAVQTLSTMTLAAKPGANAFGELAHKVVERLLPICEDQSKPDRVARMTRLLAIQTLARAGEEVKPLIPRYIAWLGGTDRIQRSGVYQSVRFLGASASPLVPKLLEIADNPANEERVRAVHALGLVGTAGQGVVDHLMTFAASNDANLASAACMSLAQLGPVAASAAPKLRELSTSRPEIARDCRWAADVIDGKRKIDDPAEP